MEAPEPSKPPSTRAAAMPLYLAATCAVILLSFFVYLAPADEFPGNLVRGQEASASPRIVVFQPSDAAGLVRVLDAAWDGRGASGSVPNVAPRWLPDDIADLDVATRKSAFLRGILPYVLAANRRIREEREALVAAQERLDKGETLSKDDVLQLRNLAEAYRLDSEGEAVDKEDLDGLVGKLLERVDVVPPSLALAQAALESAWGLSRFLREGNNLFGQWVFSRHKGMAPQLRPAGANYAVARFSDLGHAVMAYVRNLNTLWAYEDFRSLRAEMREKEAPLDSLALAEGLLYYSERREAYVDEVRRVIRGNRLVRYDDVRLGRLDEKQMDAVLAEGGRVTASEHLAHSAPDA